MLTAERLYRKRFIPNELVCLSSDKILLENNEVIVTSWQTLKPRKDISHGVSCYWMSKGIKVSRIYNSSNEPVYYYCDIIEQEHSEGNIIFTDLLLDVIIYPDGFVKVTDIDEIADALDAGLITVETAKKALRILSYLLNEIYENRFDRLTVYL